MVGSFDEDAVIRREDESRAASLATELNALLPGLRASVVSGKVWIDGLPLDVAGTLLARLRTAATLDPFVDAFSRRTA